MGDESEAPSSANVTCFESDILTGATLAAVIGRVVEALKEGAARQGRRHGCLIFVNLGARRVDWLTSCGEPLRPDK